MRSPVLRRLLLVPVIAFVVVVVVFFVVRALPGDAAQQLTATMNGATPEDIAQVRQSLGLDGSLAGQFWAYLDGLVHLRLGSSFYSGREVADLLGSALPVTIELAVAAALVSTVVGVLTGILAARHRDTWIDSVIRGGATIGFSLPWFALAVLAIVVFGVWLEWLPIFGRLPNTVDYQPTTGFVLIDAIGQGRFDLLGPWLRHLALPALTLAATSAGFVCRITREAYLTASAQGFVRTARMKGLPERRIALGHVLRNASVPILTVSGLQFGSLLGGAVITETVFSYPGVGSLLVEAVNRRDYFLVQGAALAIGLMFTLVNAIVDLAVLAIDPRTRRAH
ncbi:ABC transporter permease [Amycolatopsis sp. K13G38]|uniref:ABC transporter permease n=1 Tax=Amycolatopsis acididurans TaxID=2724524 RepID=A0ABX1IV12_9PSEU|nr:ABC transporter permease [Amycolatopsis acididurans]